MVLGIICNVYTVNFTVCEKVLGEGDMVLGITSKKIVLLAFPLPLTLELL